MAEPIAVALTDDVRPGQPRRVVVKGTPIALFNTGAAYHAIEDTCTHDEASLSDGEQFGEVVECPLHGARFNVRTGKVLSLPAVYPVRTFPVRVVGEQILVEV